MLNQHINPYTYNRHYTINPYTYNRHYTQDQTNSQEALKEENYSYRSIWVKQVCFQLMDPSEILAQISLAQNYCLVLILFIVISTRFQTRDPKVQKYFWYLIQNVYIICILPATKLQSGILVSPCPFVCRQILCRTIT